MKLRKVAAILLAGSMILSLAACGSGGSSATETNGAETGTETANAETDAQGGETTGDAEGGIVRGGTVTLRRVGVTPINPTQTIAPEGDMMTYSLFFETLTWLEEGDFTASPNLAESWTWSDDYLQLDMTLASGATFFDGTPVNAEAVKATFDFYLDENYTHAQASYLSSLESVEVVDDLVVRFNFTEPDSGFLSVLSQPVGIILSPGSIEKFKETSDPEVFAREGGCGPFILDEFLDGESLTAVKNENYYRMGEDGQPLPYLDSVVVQIVADEAVMAANMESGDVQVVDFFSGLTYIDQFDASEDITLYEIAPKVQYILYMNTTKAPFDNIAVREALCYAFDREELINVLAGGNGYTTPTIVLPTQTFYTDEITNYGYDPEKSKELLASAGYADGVDIDLYFGTYGTMQDVCELLQAQAGAAGFNITLQPTDGATVKQLWASYDDNAPAGLRINDLGHPKASPYIQMEYTFGADALQNCSKYFDADFQELLAKVRTTIDQDESDEILRQMQVMIDEDIPIVSLYTANKYSAYRNEVKGLRYNGGGTMVFTSAWLAQ